MLFARLSSGWIHWILHFLLDNERPHSSPQARQPMSALVFAVFFPPFRPTRRLIGPFDHVTGHMTKQTRWRTSKTTVLPTDRAMFRLRKGQKMAQQSITRQGKAPAEALLSPPAQNPRRHQRPSPKKAPKIRGKWKMKLQVLT